MNKDEIKDLIQRRNRLSKGMMYNLLKTDIGEIEYHIDDVIPKGQITLIYGPGGHFKSSLSLYFSLCLVAKRDTFYYKNKNDEPVKALIIDEEMGIVGLKDKTLKIMNGLNVSLKDIKDKLFYESIQGFKFNKNGEAKLKRLIAEHDIDVVIIDSLSRCIEGTENDVENIRKLHDILRKLAEQFGTSFIIIHHDRKDSNGGVDDLRGSGDIANQVDRIFHLNRYGKNSYCFKIIKSRYGESIPAINFDVNDVDDGIELIYTGLAKDNYDNKIDGAKNAIIKILKNNGIKRRKEIQDELKLTRGVIQKALDQLKNEGKIKNSGRGEYKNV